MKRWLWLARIALGLVVGGVISVVTTSLVRVILRIEYSDEPVISEWSIESNDPMPDSMKSVVGEGAGMSLERALIVKQDFHRLFGDHPPRPEIIRFTCWKVVDPALQEEILQNVRVPDKRYRWMENTYQYSRFKPQWWPADLTPFLPHENKFQTRRSLFVSLSDRTRLY